MCPQGTRSRNSGASRICPRRGDPGIWLERYHCGKRCLKLRHHFLWDPPPEAGVRDTDAVALGPGHPPAPQQHVGHLSHRWSPVGCPGMAGNAALSEPVAKPSAGPETTDQGWQGHDPLQDHQTVALQGSPGAGARSSALPACASTARSTGWREPASEEEGEEADVY